MKTRYLAVFALVAAFAAHSLSAADKAEVELKCPVSGKAVNKDSSVEFNGGKVYFCCDNCPAAFEKDSKKFAAKANHQMVISGELVQFACPYTGKDVNPETIIDIDGAKVGFCCNGCKGKTEKATPEKQLEMVFTDTTKGFKAAEKK